MAFLNLIFLLCCLAVGFAGIALLVAGMLYLFHVPRKRMWIFAAFLVYSAIITGYSFYSFRPSAVFERQFGFAPPADVRNLKSSHWVLGDGGHITLSFTTTPKTRDRIVASGFRKVSNKDATRHYQRELNQDFAREIEDLYFHPSTGHTFYEFSGVD